MNKQQKRREFWISDSMFPVVSGWIRDLEDPARIINLDITVDGNFVASCPADRSRRASKAETAGGGSFRFVLPMQFYDGRSHSVKIARSDSSNLVLVDKIIDFPDWFTRPDGNGSSQVCAAVIECSAAQVRGFAIDTSKPSVHSLVHLIVDGAAISSQKAHRYADFVISGDRDNRRHAFSFSVPEKFHDGLEHTVEVVLDGEGGVWPGRRTVKFPLATPPPLPVFWSLDEGGHVRLHAPQNKELGRHLSFDLVCAGQTVESLRLDSVSSECVSAWSWHRSTTPLDGSIDLLPVNDASCTIVKVSGTEPQDVIEVTSAALGAGGDLHLSLRSPVSLSGVLSLGVIFDDSIYVPFLAAFDGNDVCEVCVPCASLNYTSVQTTWSSAEHVTVKGSEFLQLKRGAYFPSTGTQPSLVKSVIPLTHQHKARLKDQISRGLVSKHEEGNLYAMWWLDDAAACIRGVLVDPVSPWSQLRIEILVDGVTVAIVESEFDATEAVSSFSFDLSHISDRGIGVSLTCRLDSGKELPPVDGLMIQPLRGLEVGVLSVTYSSFELYVKGWVLDWSKPGAMVPVTLSIDGQPAYRTSSRPHTAGDAGIPPGAMTFELRAHAGPANIIDRSAIVIADKVFPLLTFASTGMSGETGPEDLTSAPPLPLKGGIVVGSVDRVEGGRISGWSLSEGSPGCLPGLIIQLGEHTIGYTRPRLRRSDVSKKYSMSGNFGFLYDLPPNVCVVAPEILSVRPVVGENKITRSSYTIPARITPEITARRRRYKRNSEKVPAAAAEPSHIAVIILNKDGAPLLDQLFSSARRYERFDEIEWIVVDHGSRDASADVCAKYDGGAGAVRFIDRGANFSFSASNNFGARTSTRPLLVFMNNDIILRQPILQRLAAYLVSGDAGIVGLRLHDVLHEDTENSDTPVQHIGVNFGPGLDGDGFTPFEARVVPELVDIAQIPTFCPAVTGALMAISRSSFDAVGGFDEEYYYGYEDVDLALKVRSGLGMPCLCDNSLSAAHYRGFTRIDSTKGDPRRTKNSARFNAKWGPALRYASRDWAQKESGFWQGHRAIIAFLVSEAGDSSVGGDYFTALELGRALAATSDIHVAFLSPERWYDLSGVDVAIVMVDRFNPLQISGARPTLQLIAWARNWFDRWCEREGVHSYHHIWASSDVAAEYMKSRLGRRVEVVRLATAFQAVEQTEDQERKFDYAFVGNRFGVARDIEFALKPEEVKGEGAVFGHNWEGTSLGGLSQGSIRYSEVNDVYNASRIVIDDANAATKEWGSVNSRVFDAIAGGALVITNGVGGVREIFGDLVPTWGSRSELSECLNYWITHPEERRERVSALQQIVQSKHSYRVRADQAKDILSKENVKARIAIKISAPKRDVNSRRWGDYHFAESLAAALRRIGYVVRIDFLDEWYGPLASSDDVTLTLRGLAQYKPAVHQVNFMWLISHPEDVSLHELSQFDHVFVASVPHAKRLLEVAPVSLSPLLQCTDLSRFSMNEMPGFPEHQVLFVGNSRNVPRPFVVWAFELGLDLSVYGGGWQSFLPEALIRGEFVPNEVVGQLYRSADYVLCDHWDDMRRFGFVSNRVFDVIASGGYVVSDAVDSICEQVGVDVSICKSKEELAAAVAQGSRPDDNVLYAAARHVAENHTFDIRATEIDRFITELHGRGRRL